MRRIFITTLILTIGSTATAVELHSRHYTTQDGLVSNTIRHIKQDSIGYIWLGTTNGLSRYDGYNFANFRLEDENASGLIDQRIMSLNLQKSGLLWIGSSANLFSCYDTHKERFVHYGSRADMLHHFSHSVTIGNDCWLYGETDGCLRCYQEGDTILSEPLLPEGLGGPLHAEAVNLVQEGNLGKQNGVWIGTDQGLYFYHDGHVSTCCDSLDWRYLRNDFGCTSDGRIFQIQETGIHPIGRMPELQAELSCEFEYKGLWHLYTRQTSYTFNFQTQELKSYSGPISLPNSSKIIDSKGWYWLHNHAGRLIGFDPKTSHTVQIQILTLEQSKAWGEQISICHDDKGIVWVSVYGNGIFAYDTHTRQTEHLTAGQRNSFGLSLISNNVKCVANDRSGSLWIGYEYGGLSHYIHLDNEAVTYLYPGGETNEILNDNYIRLISQKNGRIWMGNRNSSLFSYDDKLQLLSHEDFVSPPYGIDFDEKGNRWIGTRGNGLYCNDRQYRHDKNDPASLDHNLIYSLHTDHAGRIWVGTFGGGLDLAIPTDSGDYRFRHFFDDDYGTQNVRCILEDAWGRLWVATGNGVRIFNPDQIIADPKAYSQLSMSDGRLASNDVRTIFIDSKQRIYISESGIGFATGELKEDTDQLQLRHFHLSDGLANDVVQGFVEDADGFIWIATEYGISIFDPQNETFQSIFPSAEMTSNVFCENTATALADGRMLFGSCHGVAVINPQLLKKQNTKCEIHMTSLETGKDYAVVNFSAFDFASVMPIKYTYILEGYDKEWSRPSATNQALYKHLSPGEYHLRVRSINLSGRSCPDAVFAFTIPCPWWRTWWANLLLAALLFGILYVAWQAHKEHDRLRKKIKHDEDLYEQKIIYLTNMLHELRAPINLVKGALEKRTQAPVSEEYVTTVKDLIDQHTKMVEELPQEAIMESEQVETSAPRTLTEADLKFKEQLETIIEREISNADFTVDDFADCLHMGRTAFFRRVKEITGYSPKEYLRIARMQKAAELLATSGQTVSEIAYMVGINDPFYFSRCFKQQFGIAPSAYLKQK